ncbi:MAG: diguanylate cyclase [Oscillospiraceae bacterium]|nr:diguanylate cyclase [Oscillospiraceae bacterium]
MNTKKRSFKFKIIIPTVVILIALVVVINVFQTIRLANIGNSLINEKLSSVTNGLNFYLEESMGKSNVAALTAARNPDVIKAVVARDTTKLVQTLAPICESYLIDYFTITDKDGMVLARTYDAESYGDSILNQQNIVDALNGKVSTYFESGTLIMVSIRTGAPILDEDGKIVGAVSAGVRFDIDDKVEALKALFDSEVTIFYGDTRIATTIVRDGRSIVGTTLDKRVAEIVLGEKREYSGDEDVLGAKYKIYCKPLINPHDEAFAAIFVAIPLENLMLETNSSIRNGIIIGLGGLAIAIVLLYIMISSLSQPITILSGDLRDIANGNLGIDITVKGNDEVGNLGESLQKVADILHKLLSDINQTIEEHEKGNIDFFLDTDEFFGDYRKLADNIIDLAALGMRDQLTGIPNRRAFDNRLSMEWGRAIRENNYLSVLVLDVDKFKNYNDTFGHQQGDVALKTVAKTVRDALKRPADFPARWGGEEFVVLLPSTDTEGAVVVAENVRKEIENAVIPCADERGARVTVSIGVCSQVPMRDSIIEDFILSADAALYRAKENGRNRVEANDSNQAR